MSDATIATIVSAVVTVATMVTGFLTLWVKLRYAAVDAEAAKKKAEAVESKLDSNTAITKGASAAAARSAQIAIQNHEETKRFSESMHKKLNGGLDAALEHAISPIRKELASHAQKDEKNMEEIASKFDGLEKYVHQRNHDILDALNAQALKLAVVLEKLDSKK